MTNSQKRILFPVILIGIAVVVNLLFFGTPKKQGSAGTAPLFTASFGERTFDLKDQIGKKIILVNFWATWCPPCRDEVPLLNQLVKNVASDKFEIVAMMEDNKELSQAEREKELADFTAKIPINYPVYADADGRVADAYGTYKLPESYLIDADGTIIEKQIGPYAPQQLQNLVRKIKAEIENL